MVYNSAYMRSLEQSNSQRQKVECQGVWGGEKLGEGELWFNGYRAAVWEDENILEIDCTTKLIPTLSTCLCPQKWLQWDFPGGPVVKNPPANAGDVGLIPDMGGSAKLVPRNY